MSRSARNGSINEGLSDQRSGLQLSKLGMKAQFKRFKRLCQTSVPVETGYKEHQTTEQIKNHPVKGKKQIGP